MSQSVPFRKRTKNEVYNEFIDRLVGRGDVDVHSPGFTDSLKQHFERLPTRYALDVNTDTLDVLSHQRLLEEARADPSTVSFAVRGVEVVKPTRSSFTGGPDLYATSPKVCFLTATLVVHGLWTILLDLLPRFSADTCPIPQIIHGLSTTLPKPAFGSSPNLQVDIRTAADVAFTSLD